MASYSRDRGVRHRRRDRNTSVREVDDDVIETRGPTCIDLTGDDVIDLTRTPNVSLMDSPVVVLTPADDVGPVRTRRGSGRRGIRRVSSRRSMFSAGVNPSPSLNPSRAPPVHVLTSDDSDSDDLPDLPFEVAPPSQATNPNNSLLQSPEGVKVSCPVCMDDARHIRRSGRQIMSTVCGHIFCDSCIKTAINTQHACPTCRKKLSQRNIHPIFL